MPPSKGKQACSIKRLSHQKAPVTWATALGRATSVKRRVFRHSSQFIPPSPFRRPLCLFLFRCRTVKFSHGFRCSGRGGDSRPAIVVYKLFFQAVCELFFFCLHGHRGWVMFRSGVEAREVLSCWIHIQALLLISLTAFYHYHHNVYIHIKRTQGSKEGPSFL